MVKNEMKVDTKSQIENLGLVFSPKIEMTHVMTNICEIKSTQRKKI